MSQTIPSKVTRLLRERRALLWCCQRYDLVEGASTHDYGLAPQEALLRYRDATETDRALARSYWEAIWLEGAGSPLLSSLREASEETKTRPLVVLSSPADAEVQLSSDEFLPIAVLPGLLADSTAPDSRYGSHPKRKRDKIAFELARRLAAYHDRSLIVIGAREDGDLERLYEAIEDSPVRGLEILIVGPESGALRTPDSAAVSVSAWIGTVEEFASQLAESGIPTATQIPYWAVRTGDRTFQFTAHDTQYVLKRFALITERDLLVPDSLSIDDVQDFFSGSLDNWRPYGAGLPVDRSYRTDEGRTLPEEVLAALRRLQAHRDLRTLVIEFPSMSGAGSTTLTRHAAYLAAKAGFPTLILRPEQIEVEPEDVVAFCTTLHERAISESLEDSPPVLLILDIENSPTGPISKARQLPQILAAAGRNAVILQTTPIRDDGAPRRKQRLISLPPLEAAADAGEVTACQTVFNELATDWHLDVEVPTPEAWEAYQRSSSWHQPTFAAEASASLFWVALRFFVTAGMDFLTAHTTRASLSGWITRRTDEIRDPDLEQVLRLVAILSSFRIPSPLTTVLRPILGGVYSSKVFDLVKQLAGLLSWGATSEDLGDEMIRFAHQAIADEYLIQNGLGSTDLRVQALAPLLTSLSPGKPGDVWVAECLAFSVLAPSRHERQSAIWPWRLEAFDRLPEAVRERSKTLLHHWARCLYLSASHSADLDSEEKTRRFELAIEKIRKAIELPRQLSGREHPSHLYNTLATALIRYSRFIGERHELPRAKSLWGEARQAFEDSLATSGGGNVETLLGFADRLLDHAEVRDHPTGATLAEMPPEGVQDLLLAQSLLDDAEELIQEIPNPDPDWEQDLPRLKSKALNLLNQVAGRAYLDQLKAGPTPEIGFACEARFELFTRQAEPDRGVPKAIAILEHAEQIGVTLGSRTLLLKASLLRREQSGRAFDFNGLVRIYDTLEHRPDFQPRVIDMFRHAVALYQSGQCDRGARKFKELRARLHRDGLTPLRLRDVLRDSATPASARLVQVRVGRIMSPWKAEGYVDAIGQNVPLRPRHFAPPPTERQLIQCVIRFETYGPLAVPPRFEGV